MRWPSAVHLGFLPPPLVQEAGGHIFHTLLLTLFIFTQGSLVPLALGVPQHMLWGLVDVPQGEFAEQLVRVLGAGHDVRLELRVVEGRVGADQPPVFLAAGVDLELRQTAGQLVAGEDALDLRAGGRARRSGGPGRPRGAAPPPGPRTLCAPVQEFHL